MTTLQTLLAAIDQGDRTALYPLADLLMEQGDPRGEGVLWLAESGKWPYRIGAINSWLCGLTDALNNRSHRLPEYVWGNTCDP